MAETETKSKKKNDEAKEIINAVLKDGKVKKDFSKAEVTRGDTSKIILPEGMPLETAAEWIKRQIVMEEKVVTFHQGLRAYPLDGAYALYRAIVDIFGYVDLAKEEGPSSSTPPHMIGIKLPDGSNIQVPWGRMQFPGLDKESFLETKYNNAKMEFEIHGQFRKKFEPVVARIADRTMEILRDESIYKGKAIKVDLAWIQNGEFPSDPKFLKDISLIKDSDVLMNEQTKLNYASVLMRIERSALCVKKGIPLKHGCLLAGPYGTGKTLTAKWTAKKAVENNWTFIYLEDCRQMKDALRLAEMYAPAVVFAEDIDKAMEGGRSSQMNEILNTLDGIDTKSNPIITILTTNHIDNINPAFLRAGRIDSLIQMSPLDEETAAQFITNFGKNSEGESVLVKDADYSEAAKSLSGIVPAFASEVMNKAKMNALYRGGEDEQINSGDIVAAAKSFKEHIAFTEGVTEKTPLESLGQAASTFWTLVEQSTQLKDVAVAAKPVVKK
jgi:transitional endoplasmic reticulum ATPase